MSLPKRDTRLAPKKGEVKKLRLLWDKSDCRCTAEVGESSVSVRRFGRKGSYHWMVDSVFGAKWQDDNDYSSAEEAIIAAELVARPVFASIAEHFMKRRGGWELTGKATPAGRTPVKEEA